MPAMWSYCHRTTARMSESADGRCGCSPAWHVFTRMLLGDHKPSRESKLALEKRRLGSALDARGEAAAEAQLEVVDGDVIEH